MNRRRFLQGAAMTTAGLGAAGRAEADLTLAGELKDGVLTARWAGRPLLAYRQAPVSGPPGTAPLFTRSGYLHPLHAPGGAVVTDDFAADHPHQRGVFFAWTKTAVKIGGEELHPDFWNLGSGTARVRSERVEPTQDPLGFNGFKAAHLWELRRGEAWEPALRESWEVVFSRRQPPQPEAPGAAFVFDLTSRQTPVVRIELPQYRYGGMAVRGAREWGQPESKFSVLTSAGKGRVEADTARANWIDMSGRVGEQVAGVALLDHPGNLGAPNPVRMHPEVPYYVFTPPQAGPHVLEAGRTYLFRYRVVAHNGPADPNRLEELYQEFRRS